MTAILLDIDGVLHVSGEAVPGAPDAVQSLRDQGHRLRFVTNNTTRARSVLAGELQSIGFDLESEDITTTPLAAGKLLQGKRVLALVMSSIRDDLAEYVELVEDGADAVLLGGADESEETAEVFSYDRLNQAYAELREGARLVCLHKNKWWQTSRGPLLDSGAFVAGLEYAAGVEAEVVGKPTRGLLPGGAGRGGGDPRRGGHGRGRRRGGHRRREGDRHARRPRPHRQVQARRARGGGAPARRRRRLDRRPAGLPQRRVKVGLDLIEIGRIRRTLERYPSFRDRVFTEAEREYCDSRPNPPQHYAARFAGKEAVGKALGFGVARAFAWQDVEISGRPKPGVRLSGRVADWARRNEAGELDLSMTHSRELAAAVCVVRDVDVD